MPRVSEAHEASGTGPPWKKEETNPVTVIARDFFKTSVNPLGMLIDFVVAFLPRSSSEVQGTPRGSNVNDGFVNSRSLTELQTTKVVFIILAVIAMCFLQAKRIHSRKNAAAGMESKSQYARERSETPCPGDDPLGYLFKVRILEERRIRDAALCKERLERGEPQIL